MREGTERMTELTIFCKRKGKVEVMVGSCFQGLGAGAVLLQPCYILTLLAIGFDSPSGQLTPSLIE